ncbi:MAG: hypothetical protein JJLCMIEE_01499 [Acidimicrobiales bacterium]|nr:hypothetical protein [Acidimicrobiales bacterium]
MRSLPPQWICEVVTGGKPTHREQERMRGAGKIPYYQARDPLPHYSGIGSFPDGVGCCVSYRETQPPRQLFPRCSRIEPWPRPSHSSSS